MASLTKRKDDKKKGRLELRFKYDGAEVTCSIGVQDETIVDRAIDGWKEAVEDVRKMVETKNLPGDRVILFYNFDGSRWEIADATVMEPSFRHFEEKNLRSNEKVV